MKIVITPLVWYIKPTKTEEVVRRLDGDTYTVEVRNHFLCFTLVYVESYVDGKIKT